MKLRRDPMGNLIILRIFQVRRWFCIKKWANGDIHVVLPFMFLEIKPKAGFAYLDRLSAPWATRGLNQGQMWRLLLWRR